MNLLSNIESMMQQKPPPKVHSSHSTQSIHSRANAKNSNVPKKTFLRRGTGTINQRNKYKIEQQKQAERRRQKALGIIQTKPKTQKIVLMEQWREKIKNKEKLARKKKMEQPPPPQMKKAKSFDLKTRSSSNKVIPNMASMKLLKSKRSKQQQQNQNQAIAITNIDRLLDTNDQSEQKTPSDELDSASHFEELHHFEPAVLIKHEVENQSDSQQNNVQSDDGGDNSDVAVWTKPKLPKKLVVRPQKGYNFKRQSVLSNDRKKLHHPAYSHHRHTSLYGNSHSQQHHNKAKPVKIKHLNKKKYQSETKKIFHNAATINTVSKRDRLAAKYIHRKANEPQINAEKMHIQKHQELQELIEKYEEKCRDADTMKQSSLESFRKYQALIHDKVGNLEQRQKEFERYKKKQERILIQKTQELDKRSRTLLNIPDRKQRTKIQELEKIISDLKTEFIEKEKRHKSKLERLKKQNKKLKFDKMEIEKEMKKFEKERLEFWKTKNDENEAIHANVIRNNVKIQPKKKKKYSISKIDVNAKRPKSQHFMRRSNTQYVTATAPKTMVNRSTNNMYEQYQHQQSVRPLTSDSPYATNDSNAYHPLHFDMADNDEEYQSTSSESSSSSDESTKNGEDEHGNSVLVQNNYQKQMAVQQEQIEQKKEESESVTTHLLEIPAIYDPSKMTTEQINCECVSNPDNPLERMQHPDGKMEQVYSDGSKLILFPNGTQKYIFGNLGDFNEEQRGRNKKRCKQVYVKFPNGDVKKILFDGAEVYFYAKNNIIHATKTDGIELFFFEGQHEVHFPDKTKHIQFADGTKKYIYPNGDEQCVFPDNDDTH